jgi:hypothetical protein
MDHGGLTPEGSFTPGLPCRDRKGHSWLTLPAIRFLGDWKEELERIWESYPGRFNRLPLDIDCTAGLSTL